MRVFCLGDSLTTGYGVRPGQCWRALAAQATGFELIDGGGNGDSTWSLNYRFRRDVLPDPPDLLFLMGGGNDMLRDLSDHMARRNFEEIAQMCASSGIPLMIGLPCPFVPELAREFWSPDIDYVEAELALSGWVDWLRAQAPQWGAPLCDFWSLFASLSAPRRRELFIDGLHPRPEGHAMMALTATSRLAEFAGRRGIFCREDHS